MKFSKHGLIRENLMESCQKAKHTRIVVLKKRKLILQRERTGVPLHALRCPVCTKAGSRIDPPLVLIFPRMIHRSPRAEPGQHAAHYCSAKLCKLHTRTFACRHARHSSDATRLDLGVSRGQQGHDPAAPL